MGSQDILLLNTDEAFTEKIRRDLRDVGYQGIWYDDVNQDWPRILKTPPAMVIIDRRLGGEAGLKLCRSLRQWHYTQPILLVLDTTTVGDRVVCFEVGADDYLTKPYHSEKFRELLNLYLHPPTESQEFLHFGDLTLDLSVRRVIRGDRTIELTVKEFELLKYLMEHPQQVLSREHILENVWGQSFQGESNVIEVYIRYLRLKIEKDGEKRLIHTVRGVGYVLRD